LGELGYSLSLYQDSMGYIISATNWSQGTTKVLRKSVCIPWLYSVSLSGDSILIDIMINQIKAPFVPLKGNLPIIRNFLERQNLIFYFHGDTMHSYIAIENASKACIVVNQKINYK